MDWFNSALKEIITIIDRVIDHAGHTKATLTSVALVYLSADSDRSFCSPVVYFEACTSWTSSDNTTSLTGSLCPTVQKVTQEQGKISMNVFTGCDLHITATLLLC